MKLFVASDIHADDRRFTVLAGPNPPQTSPGQASWLDYGDRLPPDRDPMRSLISYIGEKEISADFLVVPGDIADKANGDALRQAWAELDELRVALNASATIVTAGNHDLDSRFRANPYDPKDALQNLDPTFPFRDDDLSSRFWGYGLACFESEHARFVVVNSCHHHHGGVPSEMDHGRISDVAIRRIRDELEAGPSPRHNILVCHHHPHPLAGQRFAADDRMVNGESLLALLDASSCDWLVIHGHRHEAEIMYAAGSSKSPVVLAAGSMAIRLDAQQATRTTNQVHLVEMADMPELGGRVSSWSYSPVTAWEPSNTRAGGLPSACGFGFRGPLSSLAKGVSERVDANGGPLAWNELIKSFPEIQYLIPKDLVRFRSIAGDYGFALTPVTDSTFEAAAI